VRIDEVGVPLPSRIRGVVRLYPGTTLHHAARLDADGQHRWWPIAPCARVEVALDRPALAWSGAGYLDANAGSVPLERSFRGWNWSRARLRDGTAVLYDVDRRDTEPLSLALAFDPAGGVVPFTPPPVMRLPGTRWRVARETRADAGAPVAVVQTLEDTPFYARSLLSTQVLGEPVTAIHESLSLDRFSAAWVRTLLPFRMRRAWR
jgi:carotenoid 1,2-hydratase